MQKGIVYLVAALVLASLLNAATQHAFAENATLRVGVYDNRAIAIAYAASQYNPVGEKTKEYEKAKAAGDTKRTKELEAWGEKHQRQLHRQGFARVPVDDLLQHVEAQLPRVAQETGVDVIAWSCDYAAPGVELVDITNELAMLFNPSEKTLKTIDGLTGWDPLDLDAIEAHHVDEPVADAVADDVNPYLSIPEMDVPHCFVIWFGSGEGFEPQSGEELLAKLNSLLERKETSQQALIKEKNGRFSAWLLISDVIHKNEIKETLKREKSLSVPQVEMLDHATYARWKQEKLAE
ncbi:MAG TPA: hypothetical protein HPP77_00645 [Candidatus Hydrogenedentes bacterium]|nr:hypothetical protein [Candidatus Hydrogenedentota bacterium]HIJ72972.1 hypothetical protein [Candidatus Hydrogenedentota bacterium]